MQTWLLKKLGFSDKSATVYIALLRLGPSSVRSLAEEVGLNRGSTYDALKWLQEHGLVTLYDQSSKQHFVASPPDTLTALLKEQQETINRTSMQLEQYISELQALHHRGDVRPVARYYGADELKEILEDILSVTAASPLPLYRVYSTAGIREYLYKDFPTFSDARIAHGIEVRAIAIGEGGELRGLDQRKWLRAKERADDAAPSYIIIYPGKTASISLDSFGMPMGVVLENKGISAMQETIFDTVWNTLEV